MADSMKGVPIATIELDLPGKGLTKVELRADCLGIAISRQLSEELKPEEISAAGDLYGTAAMIAGFAASGDNPGLGKLSVEQVMRSIPFRNLEKIGTIVRPMWDAAWQPPKSEAGAVDDGERPTKRAKSPRGAKSSPVAVSNSESPLTSREVNSGASHPA